MSKYTVAKEKERKFIIECIQLYRGLPALWNVKSKVYHNRDKKSMAYAILLDKYKQMYPEATKDDVKKKFNALRTNYRKELKKHLASMKYRAKADSVYEPTLWYFSEMVFLQDTETASDSESSIDTSTVQNSVMKVEDNYVEQIAKSQVSTLDDTDDITVREMTPRIALKKQAAEKAKNEEKFMSLAYKHLSDTKDDYSYWAMACAADLRKMDKIQQIYAKKAIAEILMEGQLGLLHRNSVKLNESAFHTRYSSSPMSSPSQHMSLPTHH